MNVLLKTIDLKRRYGRKRALDGLSLNIPEKSVAALVGPNGAGKTTTFALIGQYIWPHGGQIKIAGETLEAFRANGGQIGLLPQDMQFFEDRTISRQFYLFARLAGLDKITARAEVGRVLELVKLSDRADDKPEDLSRGMKVRLGIAQALIGAPSLVLLDEPTAGLDPVMVVAFREIIRALKGSTTLVISSHDLSELQSMCDWVCLIDHGKLVGEGLMSEFLGAISEVEYQISDLAPDFNRLVLTFPDYKFEWRPPNALHVSFDPTRFSIEEVNSKVIAHLISLGAKIRQIRAERSLEKAFLGKLK